MIPAVRKILKKIIPKRELGKPKTDPCQAVATEVQLIKGFRLQGNSTFGFSMSLMVSIVKMKEAKSPIILPMTKMSGYFFCMIVK